MTLRLKFQAMISTFFSAITIFHCQPDKMDLELITQESCASFDPIPNEDRVLHGKFLAVSLLELIVELLLRLRNRRLSRTR